jgi:hypothetical protein
LRRSAETDIIEVENSTYIPFLANDVCASLSNMSYDGIHLKWSSDFESLKNITSDVLDFRENGHRLEAPQNCLQVQILS